MAVVTGRSSGPVRVTGGGVHGNCGLLFDGSDGEERRAGMGDVRGRLPMHPTTPPSPATRHADRRTPANVRNGQAPLYQPHAAARSGSNLKQSLGHPFYYHRRRTPLTILVNGEPFQ